MTSNAGRKKLDAVVLVTPRSFAISSLDLRATLESSLREVRYAPSAGLTPTEAKALVSDVDGWIAGLDHITSEVLDSAPRLRVIARYGVGTDRIDLDAAEQRGVVVTNTPGVNAGAVAELVIGLILALSRGIVRADRHVRAGSWPVIVGKELSESTVGVLGLGSIGQAVGRRTMALGCRVLAADPFPNRAFLRTHEVQLASQEEVLSQADFLTLHVPLTEEVRDLVDEHFLSRMKPGSYLINVSRSELVNETALADALDAGHLAGAALDSLAEEPPHAGLRLLQHDGIIITPHIGAHTHDSTVRMGRAAAEDCLAVLAGKKPQHTVVDRKR